jgi:hypothetical protein
VPDFWLAKGDRAPSIQVTLLNADDTPIDLTGCTVLFRVRPKNKSDVLSGGPCTIVGAATAGVVRYDWVLTDTDPVGTYQGEWIITFASGKEMTVPSDKPKEIQVRARLT